MVANDRAMNETTDDARQITQVFPRVTLEIVDIEIVPISFCCIPQGEQYMAYLPFGSGTGVAVHCPLSQTFCSSNCCNQLEIKAIDISEWSRV